VNTNGHVFVHCIKLNRKLHLARNLCAHYKNMHIIRTCADTYQCSIYMRVCCT